MDGNISWPGWEVTEIIGHGGFGSVYKISRDLMGDEEFAALKIITIPKDSSEVEGMLFGGQSRESITQSFQDQVKDIVREYKIMKQMRDVPNIVHCDDVRYVQHDSGYGWDIYIQMELLTPMMKQLNMFRQEETIIRLGIDLCKALDACQKQNIIHRDIKPQNVFVAEDGHFKLGDFGIAKNVEQTTSMTVAGTYSFMAPEVATGKYDKTVDIYSLGLLLYWLLNEGRGPFVPENPNYIQREEAQKRRFAGEPIPAPKYGSKALKDIVLKACAFDPKQRYSSAAAMLEALRALERGEPVQAEENIDKTVAARPVIQPDNDRTVLARPASGETVLDRNKNPKAEEQKSWQEREQKQKAQKKTHPLLRVAIVLLLLIPVVILGVVLSRNETRSGNDYEKPPVVSDVENSVVEEVAPTINVPNSEISKFVSGYRDASSKEPPVIAFVPEVEGQAWWDYAKTGVEEWEEASGIDVIYEGPSEISTPAQIQIIKNLIDQGVDVLCVAPSEPALCEDLFQMAREAGIIVIVTEASAMVNIDFDVEEFEDGDMGDFLMEQLAEQMDHEGQYVTMLDPGDPSQSYWATTAIDYAKANYPNMERIPGGYLYTTQDEEVAYILTKQLIQEYPNLKGILGASSLVAPGAARAIEELGLSGEISVVSVAIPSQVRNYLESGVLQSVVSWNPAAKAQAMLSAGLAMYYGAEFAHGMNLGVPGYEDVYVVDKWILGKAFLPITAENVDKFTF